MHLYLDFCQKEKVECEENNFFFENELIYHLIKV